MNEKTYWKLTSAEDSVWLFETFLDADTGKYMIARPTKETTRSGFERTFSYTTAGVLTQVADSHGKVITFVWGAGGSISQANLPGGYKVVYAYGLSGAGQERLASATIMDAADNVLDKTSYDYGDATYPSFITGVRDKDDVLRWSVQYDARGRATYSAGPGGAEAATVAYSADGNNFSRTVTSALGKAAVYSFTKPSLYQYQVKMTGVTGVASSHCPASATSVSYGTDRLVSSSTDEEGRVSKFTWNTRGSSTQVVEGFGTTSARTVTTTWHATFNVPTQVVEPKLTTDYAYDTQGRLTSMTQKDTTSYTAPYATNNRTRTWTYGWSPSGQLLSMDGPLAGSGDMRSWTYNADGYLATATNEVGQVTTVTSWDWRGAPLTTVDANGVSTAMTYDVRGRMLTATLNPGGAQSHYQFAYNAMGDLTKITLPLGGYLQYTYDDARRLTQVANDRGESVTLTPNAVGAPTSAVTKAGSTITAQQTMVYDELGRLIQAVGAGSQTTNLGYDKVSNPTSLTDARGKLFTTAFDPLDRVITQTDPQAHSVRYAYDAADQVTSHKDGRQLETTMIVDGFGQVIQETSPDRGVRKYWYDAAGRLTKLVDGDNEETNYAYDNAGRRTSMSFPGAAWETVTFGYDAVAGGNKGVGRLTSVTEESGSTSLTYDAQGRIAQDAKVIQGQAYAVGYAYDANGKVAQITLPSGRIVTYARAIDGKVTAVSTKPTASGTVQSIATGVAYQPFGPLKALTYGNGLGLTQSHDQNYWLTGTRVAATGATRLDLTFDRNANGQLAGVTDNAATGRSASFGYYDAGRLQYGVGPWGDHSYAYDAAGNRTDFRTDTGGVVAYQFAVNSGTTNQVTQVQDTNGAPLRNLIYRDGGDLYEDGRVGGSTYQYYYNARKRLVVANKDTVDAAYYGYDFRNQRVWRQVMAPTYSSTHYVFDQQGHLLAEHNGDTGAVIKQYIWLDDAPLAVIDKSSGTETVYYIHTGQLGEPLVMTDASKAKVWDAYVEPFGQAQVFGTASANIDLRLPGQWAQMESGGLSQNWNRDYDPTLARYIQADPIGLNGGQNLYAYVDGRPTEWSDEQGLFLPVLAGVGVGFALGVGVDVTVQLAKNGFDWSKVDPGNALRSGIAGGIQGGLMLTPMGLSLSGAVVIGTVSGGLAELMNPCVTEVSLAKAMGFGALGGLIGGPAKSAMAGGRPLPLHITDMSMIGRTVFPQSVSNTIRSVGQNVPGSYFGGD